MQRVALTLSILAGTFAASAAHAEAAFDCRKAAVPAEKAICSDVGLQALDKDMAEVFRRARETPGADRPTLLTGQQNWLRARNEDYIRYSGTNPQTHLARGVKVLTQIYRDRIAELTAEAAGTRLPDRDRQPCDAITPLLNETDVKPARHFGVLNSIIKKISAADHRFSVSEGIPLTPDIRADQNSKGASLDDFSIFYPVHLRNDDHKDIVAENVGGSDICHIYDYYRMDDSGALKLIVRPGELPEFGSYTTEYGFCEGVDVDLQLLTFKNQTLTAIRSDTGRKMQIMLLAVNADDKLELKCRIHPFQSGSPVDFEIDPSVDYFHL